MEGEELRRLTREILGLTEDHKLLVTHHNFDEAMKRVMSGHTMFWVATQTKKIPIKAKDIKKFDAAGYTLLRKDKDGKGFRLQQGKSQVYVVPGILWETPAQ